MGTRMLWIGVTGADWTHTGVVVWESTARAVEPKSNPERRECGPSMIRSAYVSTAISSRIGAG